MFLRIWNKIGCVVFVLLCGTSYAQESYKLSVEALFDLGVAGSLNVQSSKVGVAIAHSEREDRRIDRLPEINMGLIGGYIGEPKTFGKGYKSSNHTSMPDWSQNYSLDATQLLYNGRRIKHSIDKADLQKRVAQVAVERDVSNVKLMLMDSYLELFGLYRQQEVIIGSIREAEQRLHDIRSMAKNGMVTESDVLRSELQLSSYELALTEIGNNIVIVSQQLDIALGLDENLILLPEGDIFGLAGELLPYENYLEMAYRNFPELKMAKLYVEMAGKDRQLVKSDYFPRLAVKAGNIMARPITSTAQDLYSNNWNVSLSLSYNISSLYHNKRKVEISGHNIELQRIEESRVVQRIRADVKSGYIKHNESLQRIKTLSISVEQAKENYRIVLNKYRYHLAILTDLLDASRLQMEAELQLTNARTMAVYTYYQLLHSSGNL